MYVKCVHRGMRGMGVGLRPLLTVRRTVPSKVLRHSCSCDYHYNVFSVCVDINMWIVNIVTKKFCFMYIKKIYNC